MFSWGLDAMSMKMGKAQAEIHFNHIGKEAELKSQPTTVQYDTIS